MAFLVNAIIVVLIAGVMYALTSEGLWGAALMFFNVLFAGLIAFNFYEPAAASLAANVSALSGYADTLCLLGIFIVSLVLLRLTTESIAPGMVRFPTPIYHLGRLVFGLAGGAVTIAILILAFETAPVHKKVFGVIHYDSKPPFGLALDRRWLAFFQFTTGYVFADFGGEEEDPEFKSAKVFDPQGAWLISHQNARPYGNDFVPEREGEAAAEAGTAGGGEGQSAAAQPAPAPGGRGSAPSYPGGTAGAAAGLAPM